MAWTGGADTQRVIGTSHKIKAPPGNSRITSNITATVYYMPGTMNWEETYGWRPARLWNPQVRTADASFGMKTDGEGKRFFAFNITGPPDSVVLVRTSTGLSLGCWTILAAVTLADPDLDGIGSFHFSDPGASQYPARFYSFSMP
ncbi:MAG: hypothetical protein EOP86_26730 [Verrucomicrobiaceae bacterium]|nr:MAG: hypothetical protein EOP86_26730 [Verrucomicrobiaceae bacterium]